MSEVCNCVVSRGVTFHGNCIDCGKPQVSSFDPHTDPEHCRTWVDKCNCTPETCNELWRQLDAAEATVKSYEKAVLLGKILAIYDDADDNDEMDRRLHELFKTEREPKKREPKKRVVTCRCGKTFTTTKPDARFCSGGCANKKLWLSDEELLAELQTKTQAQVARDHGVSRQLVLHRFRKVERAKLAELNRRAVAERLRQGPDGSILPTDLVSDLELSVRTANCLQNMGIETVGELILYTEEELVASKNFGRKNLKEIKALLAQAGLSLR